MSKLKSMLALAMLSAMATSYEMNTRGSYLESRKIAPDWKRKKCKSCKSFHAGWGKCGCPNNNACENYVKRKR